MNKLICYIESALKDKTGEISTRRVAVAFALLSMFPTFLAHNIISIIHGGGYVDLGTNSVALILGLVAAVAVDSFTGNAQASSSSSSTTSTSTTSTGDSSES